MHLDMFIDIFYFLNLTSEIHWLNIPKLYDVV
jgi:hypothetical protein